MQTLISYSTIDGRSTRYLALLGGLVVLILLGIFAFHHMETEGHYVTGMSNQVVWGLPHVFAIFLIVAASGALNVASIGSVFGKQEYKPLGRLSALVAMALLAGGLMILVLDLGRPDRLIVAMTHYNFKSIFTWNILLYNGFFIITAVYLWFMMERRMQIYSVKAGLVALIWRLVLTTGTGSIFGFLVARQAYDAAIFAPMFILMSFAFGLSVFILVVLCVEQHREHKIGDVLIARLSKLLGIFTASVFFISAIYHATNLYATEHQEWEAFILLGGGIYTALTWIGSLLIGTIVPLYLLFSASTQQRTKRLVISCLSIIAGGFSSLYVIIIGGQAFPFSMFPGKDVSSSFFDGVVASYTPSIWELMLGLGGLSLALIIIAFTMKILPLYPIITEKRGA